MHRTLIKSNYSLVYKILYHIVFVFGHLTCFWNPCCCFFRFLGFFYDKDWQFLKTKSNKIHSLIEWLIDVAGLAGYMGWSVLKKTSISLYDLNTKKRTTNPAVCYVFGLVFYKAKTKEKIASVNKLVVADLTLFIKMSFKLFFIIFSSVSWFCHFNGNVKKY